MSAMRQRKCMLYVKHERANSREQWPSRGVPTPQLKHKREHRRPVYPPEFTFKLQHSQLGDLHIGIFHFNHLYIHTSFFPKFLYPFAIHHKSTMKFTLLSTLGLASLAVAAPSSLDARQSSLQTVTDNYLFSISIGQFISNRNAQAGPAGLDWSSDGCSSSPDNPFGFDCT